MAKEKEKADEMIKVPASEFEQMKEQLALLSKFMTSDAKMKTAEEKKREDEERLINQVLENNRKAMEMVKVHIERGNRWGNKNAEVCINGKQYVIPKGRDVMLPRCVAEVIANSEKQINVAYDMQDEKVAEFEEADSARVFAGGYAVGG